MNAAVMLLGLTLGQAPEPDYYPLTSPHVKLPIAYKKDRAAIREVLLFVSRDQGATWELTANAPPTQEAFTYHFPDEGPYWFTMQDVNLKGERVPPDLTKVPPDQKILFDKTAPTIRITECRRHGDDVVMYWVIEDKHGDETATKLSFRSATAPETAPWNSVKLSEKTRTGVKFNPGNAGPLVVKLMAQDLAGNKSEVMREVPAAGVSQTTSLSSPAGTLSPAPSSVPNLTPKPTETVLPAAPSDVLKPTTPLAPPELASTGTMPVAPTPPQPTMETQTPPAPAVAAPAAPTPKPIASGHGVMGATTSTSEQPAPIASSTSGPAPMPATPLAGNTASTPSSFESAPVRVMNTLRFDLAYEVEQKGPSGISRVDLWVTRDDGRTWVRWSQHDGRETPIRVALDTPTNRHIEGSYGFRLVPVSGAGLSDNGPVAGDAPELRVVIDVTPPAIELYQPFSDPSTPDTLVIPWRSSDKNFGEEPMGIEWSEHPTGPWKPVVNAPTEGVVPATTLISAQSRRLPNTGRFAWRVPGNLPTHKVYLKVTARDLAGNVSEVVTPGPVLVDLAKPRAKISGIVTAGGVKP